MRISVVSHDGVEITFQEDGSVTTNCTTTPPHFFVSILSRWTKDAETLVSLQAGLELAGIEEYELGMREDDTDPYFNVEQAQVGVAVHKALFPIYDTLFPSEVFNDGFYGSFPSLHTAFRNAAQQKTLKDFITAGFGYMRKDLIRTIAKGAYSPARLSAAMLAAPYLPTEWLIEFLNRNYGRSFDESVGSHIDASENLVLLAEKLSRYDMRRILWGEDHHYVADICNMVARVRLEEVDIPAKSTASMIHDLLMQASAGFLKKQVVFNAPDWADAFTTLEINGVTPRILNSTQDYQDAGTYMRNCVGTFDYMLRAESGHGAVFLWDTGDISTSVMAEVRQGATIDFDDGGSPYVSSSASWSMHQVFHGSNAPASKEISHAIRHHLKSITVEKD